MRIFFAENKTMSITTKRAKKVIDLIQKEELIAEIGKRMMPKFNLPKARLIPYKNPYNAQGQKERLDFLKENLSSSINYLAGKKQFAEHEQLKGNIENFIGMAQIPVGLSGPLLVNGANANGEFFVPLATTEGALVASYSRGMKACRESGGIATVCVNEGVQRSPFFKFNNVVEMGNFVAWVLLQTDEFDKIVSATSRYAELDDMRVNVEGNSVILTFEFLTGDAAGQNMVTICTSAICQYILKNTNVQPKIWFIESNYSGDKKATALSFSNVRGKKVTAEVILKKEIIENVLKSTAKAMAEYWQSSTLAVVQSGSIGAQGHIANGLTALFIACGQDAACVAESAVGITRMQISGHGDLYVSLTMPSIIVGTVGGGTGLPTQKECLEILDCFGAGKARKFAEICAATAIAGEISIAAAISAGHFASAHQKLGR